MSASSHSISKCIPKAKLFFSFNFSFSLYLLTGFVAVFLLHHPLLKYLFFLCVISLLTTFTSTYGPANFWAGLNCNFSICLAYSRTYIAGQHASLNSTMCLTACHLDHCRKNSNFSHDWSGDSSSLSSLLFQSFLKQGCRSSISFF